MTGVFPAQPRQKLLSTVYILPLLAQHVSASFLWPKPFPLNTPACSTLMSIVVFEDPQCELLQPITYARLACAIHCGSYRLVDLLVTLGLPMHGIVRPHLQAIQRIDFPELQPLENIAPQNPTTRPRLLLNARTAPTHSNLRAISALLHSLDDPSQKTILVKDRDNIAAILNPPWTFAELASAGFGGLEHLLASLEDQQENTSIAITTLAVPHEVIACNMACIEENLALRIERGLADNSFEQRTDGLFVAPGAAIGDYVVTDTRKGPIIIDCNAQIGAYTLLRGPIYVGPKSKILEHSAIKDAVTLSHTTKIGGEVEASIVEPYTNKQHHGFLGHSYLGSWINLGAGTCNSDLKNTYGPVNMEYSFGKVPTNMQFLGCIMGDYSKTAINTGIFTGKVIGVCSMMYGFVTSNVPSFVNYARLFGQIANLPPEVMVSTQQRMFARRDVQQRGCDIQLIYDMYRLTQSERERQGDALTY